MRFSSVARLGARTPGRGPGAIREADFAHGAVGVRPFRDPAVIRAAGAGDGGDSRARMRGLIASARIEDGNRP